MKEPRRDIVVEIANECSGGDRMVANSAFEEISAYRRLGQERDLRPGLKRIELRENLAEMREIARVVALSRLELYDCQVHGLMHYTEVAMATHARATGGEAAVVACRFHCLLRRQRRPQNRSVGA